jgi:hypothetical protein
VHRVGNSSSLVESQLFRRTSFLGSVSTQMLVLDDRGPKLLPNAATGQMPFSIPQKSAWGKLLSFGIVRHNSGRIMRQLEVETSRIQLATGSWT